MHNLPNEKKNPQLHNIITLNIIYLSILDIKKKKGSDLNTVQAASLQK